MSELRDELRSELHDPEFRHSYASEFADMVLARQIRALRKQRGLTQKQLAEDIGSAQPFISSIEDEEYGSLTISTLKDLARAFDVYLDVRFTSFAKLLEAVEHTSMNDLEVPAFSDDPEFSTTYSGSVDLVTSDAASATRAFARLALYPQGQKAA